MSRADGRGLAHLLFSSSGRLGRTPFALAIAPVAGTFAAYDLWVGQTARLLTAWAVFLVLLFIAACLLSKRLHDLGRSGWWTAAILALFLTAWPRPEGPIGLGAAVLLAVAATGLLLVRGQGGANRFGPPPGSRLR